MPVLAPRYLESSPKVLMVCHEAANKEAYNSFSYLGNKALKQGGKVKTIW